MHPKLFKARISDENKAQLKRSGKPMVSVFSHYIEAASVDTILSAIRRRYNNPAWVEENTKPTTFMLDVGLTDKLDMLASRTGLPRDLVVRLIIEDRAAL